MNTEPTPSHPSRFIFGLFELDTEYQELKKNGRRIHVAPQPWKVLEILVTHAGHLVTREALHQQLWGDRVIEADKGLNFCILQLRRVLGDEAASPNFIETVPRRGYRFIAPIKARGIEKTAPVTDTYPEEIPTPPGKPRWRIIASTALTALIITGVAALMASMTHRGRSEVRGEREAYLRGQFLIEKDDPAETRRSLTFFERAITADPRSARAYAGLARGIVAVGSREEVETRGRDAALRALALDDGMADAHLSLSWISARYEWNWTKAERHAQKALHLTPDSARALAAHAYLLLRHPGREVQALAQAQKALELKPANVEAHLDLTWSYMYARDFERAVDQAEQALELDPGNLFALIAQIHSQIARGLLDQAAEAAAETRRTLEEPTAVLSRPARLSDKPTPIQARIAPNTRNADARLADFWRFWREWLLERSESGAGFRGSLAAAALKLGEREEALNQIQVAMEEKAGFLVFLRVDPRFDALHGDPVFEQVLRTIEAGGALPPES